MTTIQVQDSYALEPLALVPPAGPADGAGAPPLVALPYAQALALAQGQGAGFVPGTTYRLTGRPAQGLGASGDVLLPATGPRTLGAAGQLLARVPDYRLPVWAPTHAEPGALLGTLSYATTTTPGFERVLPQVTDAVSSTLYGDDDKRVFPLPFGFTFGGITYHEVMVDTNARLVFGGPYASEWVAKPMGTSAVPMVALAWTDLVPCAPGTLNVFVTGTAPHRRFVVDYYHTRMQNGIHYNGGVYGGEGLTGQIILEEGTNAIVLAQEQNNISTQPSVQGIQYAGGSYEPYRGQAILQNSTMRYLPVADRAPATQVAFPDVPQCVWRGQTWARTTGDPTQEPGTGATWHLATGVTGADAFGNTQPVSDAITYDLATDAVLTRCDALGNDVAAPALAGFPWGAPGVRGNTLRQTTLDDSLLTTPGLAFAHNTLVDCQVAGLGLQGLDFHDNRLYHLSLRNYAPPVLSGVTAYYALDPAYYGSRELVVDGHVLRDRTPELGALLTSFKEQYVDHMFTTYKDGQPISYEGVDIFSPNPIGKPAHDLIKVTGYHMADSIALRTQDFNLLGDASLGYTRLGYVTANGLKISLNGLNFPKGMSMLAPSSPAATAGHAIYLLKCTVSYLEAIGSYPQNTPVVSTVTVAHSAIGQLAISTGTNTRTLVANSTLGQGVSSGAVLPGQRGAANGQVVLSNCTIFLNGTATLFEAGLDPAYQPTLRHCVVVAADGTTTTYNTNLVLPAAPAGFTAARQLGPVHLTWAAVPGAASYQVFRNLGSGPELLATVPYAFFDDASSAAALTGGDTQYYVQAANAAGPGPATNTITVGPAGSNQSASL